MAFSTRACSRIGSPQVARSCRALQLPGSGGNSRSTTGDILPLALKISFNRQNAPHCSERRWTATKQHLCPPRGRGGSKTVTCLLQ